MKAATPLVVIASLLTLSSQAHAEIGLISPKSVHEMVTASKEKRPLVLDTRGGYKDYFSSHVPTAHHINFDTLRGTDKGVPVQYLPEDLTRALLSRAGVDKKRTHVLYAAGGTGDEVLSATMVAYVLEKYGVENVRILDGGLPDYAKAYATTQEYPNTPEGTLPSKTKPEIGVDVETVMREKDAKGTILLDARPQNEYLGKDTVWLRKGHIPGAQSFPWRQVMTETNTHKFKSPAEVEPLLKALGVTRESDVIVYCGTSREGSLLRFYLAHVMGYPNVRLYEGSWKEYASLKQYAVETRMPLSASDTNGPNGEENKVTR